MLSQIFYGASAKDATLQFLSWSKHKCRCYLLIYRYIYFFCNLFLYLCFIKIINVMKQLYQIAADALIAEMKRLNPNILSVSDFSYRFWYTLEIDGNVTVFDKLDTFLNDFPKLIRVHGLDHIRILVHYITSTSNGSCKELIVPLLPDLNACYHILAETVFPAHLDMVGSVTFSGSSCIPEYSETEDLFKNVVLFLFFADMPAYGSDVFVGWLTRRSLVSYYGDDMKKGCRAFLSPTFIPSPSMAGVLL